MCKLVQTTLTHSSLPFFKHIFLTDCQEGGTAIAEALVGLINPGGRLPVTMHFNNYTTQIEMAEMGMTQYPGRTYRYTQV